MRVCGCGGAILEPAASRRKRRVRAPVVLTVMLFALAVLALIATGVIPTDSSFWLYAA